MNSRAVLSALALVLAGCAHTRESSEPLVTAADVFLYAQMAQNAYHKKRNEFDFDDSVRLISSYPNQSVDVEPITGNMGNDIFGLAFDILEHEPSGRSKELVFAFRGTEGDIDLKSCDFRFGNRRTIQHRLATELVARIVAERGLQPPSLVFVGHSLGGGIARHVSMRFPGSRVYAFNSSPVFRAPDNYDPKLDPTVRFSVNSRGEVLKLTRIFGPEPNQTYWKIDCPIAGGMIDKHSMRRLAACLTLRAAEQKEPPTTAPAESIAQAQASISLNPWTFQEPLEADVGTVKYRCRR